MQNLWVSKWMNDRHICMIFVQTYENQNLHKICTNLWSLIICDEWIHDYNFNTKCKQLSYNMCKWFHE
jgi:hypothetical protein